MAWVANKVNEFIVESKRCPRSGFKVQVDEEVHVVERGRIIHQYWTHMPDMDKEDALCVLSFAGCCFCAHYTHVRVCYRIQDEKMWRCLEWLS